MRDVRLEQRIAVGRGCRDDFRGDVAPRAGAVVDDDLLAELLARRLSDDARKVIGAAAGREGDHEAKRAVGIGLCVSWREGRDSEHREYRVFQRHSVPRDDSHVAVVYLHALRVADSVIAFWTTTRFRCGANISMKAYM